MSLRRSRLILFMMIAIVTIVTIAIIMWFKPDSRSDSSTLSNSKEGHSGINNSAPDMSNPYKGLTLPTRNKTKFTTGLENLPRSLQGTTVDGEIIIDENKRLVVTEGLRRLFDYFLSALGEEDEATINQRVESYIRHHTPEPAASQAIVIFNQYVNYLKQIKQIEQRYGNLQLQATQDGKLDLNMLAQRQQDIAKVRQQNFDQATITAFFGSDDTYDDYSISMLTIEQNEQLSTTQKAAARQDYISRMPNNAIKANIEQQANLNELITRTEQMKAQGASAEALYNMRSKLVGAAAADRLATVDVEDANFDQRFDQYQAQRQSIVTQTSDNAQARVQITQLEQQLFSDAERKRLEAYEAMQKAANK